MILESLILLAFIALLAALFHFKIKHIATDQKIPETPARDKRATTPALSAPSDRAIQPQPARAAAASSEPPPISRLNKANPKAMASMIAHWVDMAEPPPPPPKKYPTSKRQW